MGTHTWRRDSQFASFDSHSTAFPTMTVIIPAGSTVQRIVGDLISVEGYSSGDNYKAVGPMILEQRLTLLGAPLYGERQLYGARHSIPLVPTVAAQVLPGTNLYTGYYGAGDEILGFNQRTAYGKQGYGFDMEVTLDNTLFSSFASSDLNPIFFGWFNCQLSCLCYSP